MTRAKKTMTAADVLDDDSALDDNPFADIDPGDDDDDIFATGPSAHASSADDDPFGDQWADLPGSPSETIAHDMLKRALREDPFVTTDLDDCLPDWATTPVAFSRYLRASAAFISACRAPEPDYEEQEIHRLIAIYWLKKSRPVWLD